MVGARTNYVPLHTQNHNPLAQNGFMSAWNILSGIWGGIQKTLLKTAFDGDMSWVNYQSSGMGTIVDRFRWEGGCIAEHVRTIPELIYVD